MCSCSPLFVLYFLFVASCYALYTIASAFLLALCACIRLSINTLRLRPLSVNALRLRSLAVNALCLHPLSVNVVCLRPLSVLLLLPLSLYAIFAQILPIYSSLPTFGNMLLHAAAPPRWSLLPVRCGTALQSRVAAHIAPPVLRARVP